LVKIIEILKIINDITMTDFIKSFIIPTMLSSQKMAEKYGSVGKMSMKTNSYQFWNDFNFL